MAVVTNKSTLITNRDANAKGALTDGLVSGGEFEESEGYVAPAVGDSVWLAL